MITYNINEEPAKVVLCESSDTKPTTGIETNTIALELDTGKCYYFNGTTWAESKMSGAYFTLLMGGETK